MTVKVIDRGWKRLKKEIALADGSFVIVGFPSEKAIKHDNSDLDVAGVAAIQEFGTSEIPARPFMSQSFDENISKMESMKGKELKLIYEGKQTVGGALEKIGLFFKGKIQRTIKSGGFAPNAPATIEKKGSTVPLIDSAQMRNSVDYEVVLK